MKSIRPVQNLNTTVKIPGSKSITHRAIIAAALARGDSLLQNFLSCEDTLYTINALKQVGVNISVEGERLRVTGTGGNFHVSSGRKELFLGNSGTSFRLLLPVVALAGGEYVLTGTRRMQQRPIGELITALKHMSVKASCIHRNECPPVLIRAKGISGGRVNISGSKSSQFVSSLLLSAPYAKNDVEINVSGKLVSAPYVDLTLDVMESFGVSVVRDGYRYFRIDSSEKYRATQFKVEGDVSSASYFWAAAAVTGGTVVTVNIYPFITRQGDIRFLEVLDEMGCRIEKTKDLVVVHGGKLSSVEVDMSHMPDMVPTLAAIALFCEGKTILRNVHHLRHKESDRLHAVGLEWKRLGGRVDELSDGLIIHGGRRLSGTMVYPHNDHRLAMSLAVVGLRVPGIIIKNEECADKSFPGFWEQWDKIRQSVRL